MDDNKLVFKDDEGNEVEFWIIDQTEISQVKYILVEDSDGEEGNAYILKEVPGVDDQDDVFEFVEDDDEFDAVAKVFNEIVDDVELI